MLKHRFHPDRELILLFVLAVFALVPLVSPGYFFNAHDADHSVFFLIEFDKGIRDGILWPRWGPDHAMGYGYPIWLIYAPLAYYGGEFFHLLGLGFTAAVKATWAVGFLWGGCGMYFLLRRWFGRTSAGRAAALIGGLLYVYAPYHLLTIYVRAALAEFSAMAWFPWVLLAFDRLFDADTPRPWRSVALAALAYAGLLLTHTGTILLFTPLLLAFLLLRLLQSVRWQPWPRSRGTALRVAAGGFLAVGLAALFLFPMVLEQRFIAEEQWVQGSYGYRGHFVYASQWLDPLWGYGYSDDLNGPNDGMSFQLGTVGVALALVAAAIGLRRKGGQRALTLFFLLATLAVLFLMSPASVHLWDGFGPAALIQFPWRLLGLASFGLSILGGAVVASLLPAEDKSPVGLAGLLALVIVLGSLPFTLPQYTLIEPLDESVGSIMRFEMAYPDMIGRMADTQTTFTETPLLAQYLSGQPLEKAALLSGDGSVHTTHVGSAAVRASVDVNGPATVQFYTYDFPGWYATLDGQRVPHRTQPPYGLIAVDVPAGQHDIAIRFGTTPVRTASLLLSLVSLALTVWLLWKR
ncbi:MAG: hypothetical protein WAZ19_05445 [Anaerolineae bacterium]